MVTYPLFFVSFFRDRCVISFEFKIKTKTKNETKKTNLRYLKEHQVIRQKMTEMIRLIESTQCQLENVTYLMKIGVSETELSRHMALIKIQASKCMEYCANQATQIIGGRAYLRGTGIGSRVERIYREVTVMGIAEGASEVLADFVFKKSKL